MKQVLTIIFGLFLISNLNCQTYFPFPSDSAQWNCLFWHQWSANDINLFNSSYLLEGDTNLNGKSYKKVYYTEQDNPDFNPEYIGGLRENDTKDIYFFPVSVNLISPGPISFPNDTSEQLLYTFNNLDTGMVLPINTGFTEITVIGTDSVLLGDSYHKRYKMQQEGLSDYDYWIEGIGSIKDLFIPFTYEFEWQYYTLCFTNLTTYYINSPNREDSCHYWIPVGLTEHLEDEVYLYPNPASQTIFIKSNVENQTESINIYNSLGKHIVQDELIASELELNIEQIESGLYIVEIESGRGKQYLKFIKK
jgi:hypothetical protein